MSATQLNTAALATFLAEHLPQSGQPGLQVDPVAGGQSNPTFFVQWGNRALVLRKKPAGDTLPSAHAVDREARVMQALAPTPVPVPNVVLFHADPGLLGTPFYLMDRVPGRVFPSSDLPGASPAERRPMVLSAVATLAALHDVDWQAAGLGDYGRPGDYFARQIARWTRQWQAARFRDIPDLTRLGDWLGAHKPADDGASGIVHGDFRLGNMLFAPDCPAVAAVLDWELSTIGHPMSDLAFLVLGWRSAPSEYGGLLGLNLDALGLPTEAEVVAHYMASRCTPAPVLLPWHIAFAAFRFAVIFEGIAARARAGTAAGDDAARVGELSLAFAARGLEAAGAS